VGAASELGLVAAAVLAVAAGVFYWRAARRPYSLSLAVCEGLNELLCRLWYRLRRDGPCPVPDTGPVIIVPNHTCTADPLFVCAACQKRKISFMIAKEYAELPFWRYFVRLVECIPVRRDGRDVAATKQALRHLRANKALTVFIEGRIPAPGQKVEPRDGPALLALRSGATVIPCHISGTLYRDGILAGFLARHRARVCFGPPVDLSDLAGQTGRETVAAATKRIYECICALAPV
jgi:1-acyl-sn-glycerol-3-phosphate acyltransferase